MTKKDIIQLFDPCFDEFSKKNQLIDRYNFMTKYFIIPRRKKLKIFKAPICLKRTASFSFSELDQNKAKRPYLT